MKTFHIHQMKRQSNPIAAALFIVFAIMLAIATAVGVASAFDTAVFEKGDVFAAVDAGQVKRFRPDGTLIATYDTDAPNGETAGMAFDEAGNLYLTHFGDNQVYKFNHTGALVGTFGESYDESPESIAIDKDQNVYIGQAYGGADVLKFAPDGHLIQSYDLPTEVKGTDWIDLSADQKTLFYTSEGKYINRYDLEKKHILPHFNQKPLPGSTAYAFRILPDGGVIVADREVIVRLDKKGKVKKSYDAPGEDGWFAINLDPDGKTFWSGDIETGEVYRFDAKSGKVISHWNSDPNGLLGGLAVFGEIRMSQPFTVTMPLIPSWVWWLGLIPLLALAVWLWQRLRPAKHPVRAQPGRPSLTSTSRGQRGPVVPLQKEEDPANLGKNISHGRSRNPDKKK